MSAPSESRSRGKPATMETMHTTSVDSVASLLLSLVIMIGLGVFALGLVFILSTMKPHDPIRIFVEEERIAGRGDNAAGFARDLEPPGSEEAEQLTEPAVEQSLQAVTETLSSISASLETVESGAAVGSKGSGQGDSRPPGPEGEGDNIIPRFERWELKFTARDSKSYAKQLDFFKIELGAIGGGRTEVDYLGNLSAAPEKRTGPGKDEKRMYFVARSENQLQKYEKDLLSKSGIATSGSVILKLISKELEQQLAELEKSYAVTKRGPKVMAKEFAKTVFECQPGEGKGYQWVVVEQRYRTVP